MKTSADRRRHAELAIRCALNRVGKSTNIQRLGPNLDRSPRECICGFWRKPFSCSSGCGRTALRQNEAPRRQARRAQALARAPACRTQSFSVAAASLLVRHLYAREMTTTLTHRMLTVAAAASWLPVNWLTILPFRAVVPTGWRCPRHRRESMTRPLSLPRAARIGSRPCTADAASGELRKLMTPR